MAKQQHLRAIVVPGATLILTLVLALSGSVSHLSGSRSTSASTPHRVSGGPFYSGNEGSRSGNIWAGYEAVDWNSYQEINGDWTVVSVDPNVPNSDLSQWVGFNGDSNEVPQNDPNHPFSPLVQIGTDSVMGNNVPILTAPDPNNEQASCMTNYPYPQTSTAAHYFAWAEVVGLDSNGMPKNLLPGGCALYLFSVQPGQHIVASITFSGGNAYLAIDDTTSGEDQVKTFSYGQTLHEYTADWIVERAGADEDPLRLVGATPSAVGFNTALIKANNNVWYGINYNSYYADEMYNEHRTLSSCVKTNAAVPGGLQSNGTAFSFTLLSSLPFGEC